MNKDYSIKNINSLYKGCSIPLLISSTKRGLQLSIYDNYKDKNTYFAGAISGMISSLALNPINIDENIHLDKTSFELICPRSP